MHDEPKVQGGALVFELLPRVSAQFSRLDAGDSDAAVYYDLFLEADRDGSQDLTSDEFARLVDEAQRRRGRPAYPRRVADVVFDKLDTDHSGSLTLAEFSPEKVQEELEVLSLRWVGVAV